MNAEILRRLAALELDGKAMSEVLSIIADLQAVTDERRAKDRERKRNVRGNSEEIPQTIQGMSEEKVSPSLPPFSPPHTPPYNPPNPPPSKTPRVSLSAECEEFWTIYPKRPGDNRHGAFKAFEKAVKAGVSPQTILAGARRFAAAMAGQERQFIKGAAVWLNNRCWLDDFAPVGPNVLPFGTADPPKREFTDAEKAEAAARWKAHLANEANA